MNIFIDTEDIEERYGEELYKENLEKENKRLNNIINELEKWLEYEIYCDFSNEMTKAYQDSLDKLKELRDDTNVKGSSYENNR